MVPHQGWPSDVRFPFGSRFVHGADLPGFSFPAAITRVLLSSTQGPGIVLADV